jgi:hypothetical protein
MAIRSRPRLMRTIAMAFVSIWGLGTGCNPGLIQAIGGDPVTNVTTPDGYILILIINKSNTSINTQINISKTNGTVYDNTFSVPPLLFFTIANDCDVTSVQVENFSYATTSGLVTNPSNLGVITATNGLSCGKVMAITASGNPPTFSVQVY